jgi:exopolysaccharide biosynthesis protein
VRVNCSIRRRRATVIGACAIAIVVVVAPAIASTRTSATFHLATDVSLKKVRDSVGPQQIRVLTVSPGTSVPDIASADHQFPMWSHTSTMAANAGAIAAVNGDFGTATGQPKHMLMIDGELWTTGQSEGTVAAWSAEGTTAYVGHPRLKILATDRDRTNAFFVQGWNAATPRAAAIQGYTARGGTVTRPPGNVSPQSTDPRYCAARLVPISPIGWNGKRRTSIVRRYTVGEQPAHCRRTPLGFAGVTDAVVLATRARSPRAKKITRLEPGDTVRLSFTFGTWRDVTDVMGASQLLVKGGVNVAPSYQPGDNYILNYNPRTAIGITKGCSDLDAATNCRIILVTVDGRQTGWSAGVRLPYLADELIRDGAYGAVNLDGGGSTTMWTKKRRRAYCESSPPVGGCLVQRPSDSTGERSKQSAIVVLPTADAGTPPGLR